jgi:hypothetical protein
MLFYQICLIRQGLLSELYSCHYTCKSHPGARESNPLVRFRKSFLYVAGGAGFDYGFGMRILRQDASERDEMREIAKGANRR